MRAVENPTPMKSALQHPLPPAQPPRRPSLMYQVALFLVMCLGVLYILNPTAGLFELLPDNIPIFGNLDEAGATALVIWAGRELFFRGKSPR